MLEWIQSNVFEAVVLPAVGIAIAISLLKGKWGYALAGVVGVLIACAFVYGDSSTWGTVGDGVGQWFSEQVAEIRNG